MVVDELKNSHGRVDDQLEPAAPDSKVKLMNLARCDEGDCHTPGATNSLVPVAPDPKLLAAPAKKFRLSALTKDFVFVG